MTTDVALPEEVNSNLPVKQPGPIMFPISFDVNEAKIAELLAKAETLTIAGHEDKTGFEAMKRFRIDEVKDLRFAVEERAEQYKRPHLDYNRDVNDYVNPLINGLKKVEGILNVKEKAYLDERQRIADEKALAERVRMDARVKELRAFGFDYDAQFDAYQAPFTELVINLDDIRELSDEDYAPTVLAASTAFQAETDRLNKIKADQQAEAARIAAELAEQQRQFAQAQAELLQQQNELKRQQQAIEDERRKFQEQQDQAKLNDRIARLIAAGFVEYNAVYSHGVSKIRQGVILSFDEQQFDSILTDAIAYDKRKEEERIQQEAAAAELAKKEKQDAADKKKADKERNKRLGPDRNLLHKAFVVIGNSALPMPTEPETTDLRFEYITRLSELTKEFTDKLAAL